jgi:hypothetical protein
VQLKSGQGGGERVRDWSLLKNTDYELRITDCGLRIILIKLPKQIPSCHFDIKFAIPR